MEANQSVERKKLYRELHPYGIKRKVYREQNGAEPHRKHDFTASDGIR